jgi:hypothetical protein
MYEDIEIFRRILEGALPAPHAQLARFKDLHALAFTPDLHALAFTPDGKHLATEFNNQDIRLWHAGTGKALGRWVDWQGAPEIPGPEGVYLRGYGIVYSMTMPWHYRKPLGDSAPAQPQPLGRWERIRQEVRGEPVKPEAKKQEQEEPSLADTVLKLLADNGRHFSQLPANEQLTVAITLRPMQSCSLCHAAGMAPGGKIGDAPTSEAKPVTRVPTARGAAEVLVDQLDQVVGQGAAGKGPGGKDSEAKGVEASNFSHLGDLRLKQGRTQEAVEAYRKAIAIYDQLTAPKGPADLSRAEAYSKLAQAYLLMGEREKAYASLLHLTQKADQPGPGDVVAKAAGDRSASLPAKLIISASKSLLDQVGAGKMNFEDFRKAATVQFVEFPVKPATPRKEELKTP